jgi:hypothetical protein
MTPVANLPTVLLTSTPVAKMLLVSTTLAQNLPLVSTTPAANFASGFASGWWQICHRCQRRQWQITTSINDTAEKFATCGNDTGGKEWEQLSDC